MMRPLYAVVALSALSPLAAEHTRDALSVVKKSLSDGKAALLDVREQGEWDDGHLKDAVLLPLSKIARGASKEDVAKLVPPGKIVYIHCGSGVRCLKAADTLKKLGYDVRPLKEGYMALIRAGFEKAGK